MRGFSIIELLVSIFITVLILGLAYVLYNSFFKHYKTSSSSLVSQMEDIIGYNIIRLDLEHVGYGIASDETTPIIKWNSSSKELVLHSTLNVSRKETEGYLIASCSGGSLTIDLDARGDSSAKNATVIRGNDKTCFATNATISGGSISVSPSCSQYNRYVAFPLPDSFSNKCNKCQCLGITYKLISSNLPKFCAPNTNKLQRVVGDGKGTPIINCVSDFKPVFALDTNGDGKPDELKEVLPSSNADIRNQLKQINLYILVQEGQKDSSFTYKQVAPCSSGGGMCVVYNDIDPDGNDYPVELKLPSDYKHYRWRVIKISAKPMDLQ